MPIIRGSTSRGAHIRALWEALTCLIEQLPSTPVEQRVRLRNARAALERAYPAELVTETDIAQAVAEDDNDAQAY